MCVCFLFQRQPKTNRTPKAAAKVQGPRDSPGKKFRGLEPQLCRPRAGEPKPEEPDGARQAPLHSTGPLLWLATAEQQVSSSWELLLWGRGGAPELPCRAHGSHRLVAQQQTRRPARVPSSACLRAFLGQGLSASSPLAAGELPRPRIPGRRRVIIGQVPWMLSPLPTRQE